MSGNPEDPGQADTYFNICRWVERELDLRMLTPEYEIVAVLFDVPKMTPLELQGLFSGSNTAFYKQLGDLTANGAITAEPNPEDGRSKLYRLSDQAEAQLSRQWLSYNQRGREETYSTEDPNEVIYHYTRTVRTGLKVTQFTAEFQLLLHIHSTPGISNLEVSHFVNVSQSKLNESLKSLKERSFVYFNVDGKDRRRKSYFINDAVRDIFVELDRRIFAWLDGKAERFAARRDATVR